MSSTSTRYTVYLSRGDDDDNHTLIARFVSNGDAFAFADYRASHCTARYVYFVRDAKGATIYSRGAYGDLIAGRG